jgi:hypothetical protein
LAGQELAAMMGAYTGLLGARSNVAQESALGQFDVARQKDLIFVGSSNLVSLHLLLDSSYSVLAKRRAKR